MLSKVNRLNSFSTVPSLNLCFAIGQFWSTPLHFLVQHVQTGGSASTRASPLQGNIPLLISSLKWACCLLVHAKEPGEVSSGGD